MNINLNISTDHMSYAAQQAASDDTEIHKVIERALSVYQLYRYGKIMLVHINEDEIPKEQIETPSSTSDRDSEADTDDQIQEG